jgi:predicted metal-dependent hydrolase
MAARESGTGPSHEHEGHGVLEIGATRIAYAVRESERASRTRIVVEPGSVEVVVPTGVAIASAHAFVHAKRRWVFDKVREVGAPVNEPTFERGSKVRYRGRWLTVEVTSAEAETVNCRGRFHVTLPYDVSREERAGETERVLRAWMQQRLLHDAELLAARYAERLEVPAPRVRLVAMRRAWATCGKDRVLRLNPTLTELPRAVFEYVIAHEVAHLVERNHSPKFWRVVGKLVPEWREREAWLAGEEAR